LRTLLRHRPALIAHRAPHILHMPKALTLMHRQLSDVLTAITGGTGQALLRAIVPGERDPLTLAPLRHPACQSAAAALANALIGSWRTEQLFIPQQALALFDCYTPPLAACEAQIERQFAVMKPRFESDAPLGPFPRVKPGSTSKNPPRYAARAYLACITGVELVAVTGLAACITC
jgi:hypothetical protein